MEREHGLKILHKLNIRIVLPLYACMERELEGEEIILYPVMLASHFIAKQKRLTSQQDLLRSEPSEWAARTAAKTFIVC
jgi:hypothetical protein